MARYHARKTGGLYGSCNSRLQLSFPFLVYLSIGSNRIHYCLLVVFPIGATIYDRSISPALMAMASVSAAFMMLASL